MNAKKNYYSITNGCYFTICGMVLNQCAVVYQSALYSWESGGLRFGFSSRRNLTAVDNPLAVLHLKNRLYFGTKKMHEGHGMKPPKKGKSRLFLKVQYLYNARIFPISVLHQPFLYFRTFSNIFKNILTALCRVYFIGLRNVGRRK